MRPTTPTTTAATRRRDENIAAAAAAVRDRNRFYTRPDRDARSNYYDAHSILRLIDREAWERADAMMGDPNP